VRRGLLAFVLLAAVLVPGRADAARTIQPGDEMWSREGGCTLGFVVADASNVYFMSAAHCVKRVGDNIELTSGTVFADVAAIGSANASSTDWSLLKVRPNYAGLVRAAVRGHEGTPKGYTTWRSTSQFDVIDFSGHGIPWFVTAPTREERSGVLMTEQQPPVHRDGPHTFGDSGGPVVHRRTGKALGLVSELCLGTCTSEGPTVERVLSQARLEGFRVALRRA
jgi:hypothetical protein